MVALEGKPPCRVGEKRSGTVLQERRQDDGRVQGSFVATGTEATYDVSADGQRFLMLQPDAASASESIVVIQDWMDEVKALVSRGK